MAGYHECLAPASEEHIDTYWGKTQYFTPTPPWELRCIPGKGYAAFARYPFVKGDIICIETPVTWVHGHHPFEDGQIAEIDDNISKLDENERDAFLFMANAFPEISSKGAGIFMTNSFDMTDAPHGESCGMYCAIARLNHSCNPNAQQTHIPETGEEILIASRSIAIGEEINDCYIDLRQTRLERQRILQELYRFDCECPTCLLPAEESVADDKARKRAMDLDAAIVDAAEFDADTALVVAEQYLSLLKANSSVNSSYSTSHGWSDRYMAAAHYNIYQIAFALGNRKKAKLHVKESHIWNVLLQGERAPDSTNTASILTDL